MWLRSVLRDANFAPPKALRQLAEITDFDLFITTTFDSMLESAINTERFGGAQSTEVVSYAPNRVADLPSEREQLQRRYQVAQAQADRAAMGVLAAQMNQAEAQLSLVEERLARATVVAPYDGVVVSGDLSQQIGSPVETGRLLFEVAPLQGYRVMLEVDDRDIARLATGQGGEIVLSGMPGRQLPITVQRITPVATQRDGLNLFAVEAAIEGGAPPGLRPGMEGVGKIVAGERSILWVWTHRLTDWLRLSLWRWLP